MTPAEEIAHTNGIPFWEAPLPWRWHRCQPWSWMNIPAMGLIQRCACGAIRRDQGTWIEKNSRRSTGQGAAGLGAARRG